MARDVLASERLLAALRKAGLCDDDTVRVVIDIRTGHRPVIYTERLADREESLLSVATALGGIQVQVRAAEEG
jgi:hypothetical protein